MKVFHVLAVLSILCTTLYVETAFSQSPSPTATPGASVAADPDLSQVAISFDFYSSSGSRTGKFASSGNCVQESLNQYWNFRGGDPNENTSGACQISQQYGGGSNRWGCIRHDARLNSYHFLNWVNSDGTSGISRWELINEGCQISINRMRGKIEYTEPPEPLPGDAGIPARERNGGSKVLYQDFGLSLQINGDAGKLYKVIVNTDPAESDFYENIVRRWSPDSYQCDWSNTVCNRPTYCSNFSIFGKPLRVISLGGGTSVCGMIIAVPGGRLVNITPSSNLKMYTVPRFEAVSARGLAPDVIIK
jgi:hypothetical protein